MRLSAVRILFSCLLIPFFFLTIHTQSVARELKAGPGSLVQIINRAGRVGVRAFADNKETPFTAKLRASGERGAAEEEIKTASSGSTLTITVKPSEAGKRIDLIVDLPERSELRIETAAGSIEVSGNFALVDARTDTGTISTDIPSDDLKYNLWWTESRPRYLADFDISTVKERSGGKFEIKGTHRSEDITAGKVKKVQDRADTSGDKQGKKSPPEASVSKSVEVNLTTARGIILLNVPPNEVMSDLRERPLTEAAKAIVRSGDSLLMEAIRRASPKYFGEYARTLPPLIREPRFSERETRAELPNSPFRTATVRVSDLNNRAIPGLQAADFEVTENGEKREIVSVDKATAPFNLVLLLDVSGSVENYVNFIRKAARGFIDTVDRNDRIAIITFNDDIKLISKFTTDKGKLSESLDSFDAGGGTAYYDALAYTIADTLRPLKGDRSAVVILTDGEDNRSFLAFDSLAGSIQESGSLIYPLYVPSGLIAAAAAGADIDPLRKKYMSLSSRSQGEGEKLAKISGGVYYPITQIGQIQRAYDDIVLQLRSAYEITYKSETSVPGGNGASPRLKVRAKRENTFTTINSVVARS